MGEGTTGHKSHANCFHYDKAHEGDAVNSVGLLRKYNHYMWVSAALAGLNPLVGNTDFRDALWGSCLCVFHYRELKADI